VPKAIGYQDKREKYKRTLEPFIKERCTEFNDLTHNKMFSQNRCFLKMCGTNLRSVKNVLSSVHMVDEKQDLPFKAMLRRLSHLGFRKGFVIFHVL